MPLPPSALKQAIEKLPLDWKMKKQSVMPYLQKRGIKLEELEYSGMEKGLANFEGDKLTREDLAQLEANRQDIQSEINITGESTVGTDTVVPGTKGDTYSEKVRTYGSTQERNFIEDMSGDTTKPARRVKSHYSGIDDYLWHTRTSEDLIGDKPTRVIQEVQSDLHQQGRTKGYETPSSIEQLKQLKEELQDTQKQLKEAEDANLPDKAQQYRGRVNELSMQVRAATQATAKPVPDAPFKTSWSRKAIEQEILDAHATGKEAVAIPLEGVGIETLDRSPGVQKWYETQIRSTMKKIAKAMGGEYKEVPVETKFSPPPLPKQQPTTLAEAEEYISQHPETQQYIANQLAFSDHDNTKLGAQSLLDSWEFLAPTKEVPPVQTLYGQIVLPKDKEKLKTLSLYSAGGAEALLISQSLDKGALPPELQQFLVQEQNMSEEDAQTAVDNAVKLRVESSLNQGASPEEILDFTEEQGYDRAYIEGLMTPSDDMPPQEQQYKERQKERLAAFAADPLGTQGDLTPQERIDRVSNIYTKYSAMPTQLKVMAGFGSQADREQAQADLAELNTFVVSNLEKEGVKAQIDPNTSELWVFNEDSGDWQIMEPGLLDSLRASRSEIMGAVSGGLAAHRATTAMRTTPGPWQLKALTGTAAFAATVAGGAAGATFGRYHDMTRNAVEAKENIEAAIMMDQLKEAAAADAVFSVAGAGIFKTGVAGVKQIYKGYDLLVQGNKEGAYRALKELMHLTDDQIDEIITGWESVAGQKAPGFTRATKALHVVPRTTPGGEAIVQPAAAMDPLASANAAKEIDLRAQNLLEQADAAASGNMSTILRDELKTYKQQVKQVYTGVKDFGVQEMAESGYRFDYSKLAIDPIVERAANELTNPALRERAFNYLQRIRQLGGVTEEVSTGAKTVTETIERPFRRSGPGAIQVTKEVPVTEKVTTPTLRSFEDLLELRRVLNEFGNSRLLKNKKDIDMVTNIRSRIDGEITRAAKNHMDQPKEWLEAWRSARTEYSKMFDLEANVLYKQIMRTGTTDKLVARQLMNRAMATDNTFRQVLEKLPPKMQALTENAVLQEFVEKFTAGEAGGLRAVNFPQLTEQLKQISFATKKAQDLKRVVSQMSEVFKNDVDLARATGTIRTPQFQSYLTTDPVVRAKYEIASTVFNYIKRVLPGSKADAIALVMQTGKVLEKPMHAKTFEQLLRQLPEDPTLRNTLKSAQLQLAKFGEPSEYPHVPLYRYTAPGKTLQSTPGPLGDGLYYQVAKGKPPTGTKLSTRNILPERIAGEDDLKTILGVEEVTPKVLKQQPKLQELLKDKGYVGLSLGDQVLVFK